MSVQMSFFHVTLSTLKSFDFLPFDTLPVKKSKLVREEIDIWHKMPMERYSQWL